MPKPDGRSGIEASRQCDSPAWVVISASRGLFDHHPDNIIWPRSRRARRGQALPRNCQDGSARARAVTAGGPTMAYPMASSSRVERLPFKPDSIRGTRSRLHERLGHAVGDRLGKIVEERPFRRLNEYLGRHARSGREARHSRQFTARQVDARKIDFLLRVPN